MINFTQKNRFIKIFLFIILFLNLNLSADIINSSQFNRWKDFSKKNEAKILIAWLNKKAESLLSPNIKCEGLNVKVPEFYGYTGIFITLIKGKKVRGCFGSFYHSSNNIEYILTDYLKGAIFRDFRHQPLEIHELKDVKIILTISTFPCHVADINSIDFSLYGVLLSCEGRIAKIFVPEELLAISYLDRLIGKGDCYPQVFRAITIK
jgi:AMMECR1 domain-containing protein